MDLKHENTFRAIASSRKPMLEGVRVLLVEDEPDIAELLLIVLENAGAEVILVTDARAALDALGHRPDILISNIKLPNHSGEWLIREIRSREAASSQHLPAIAVSSYTREVHSKTLLDAGFEYYFPKPNDPDELVAAIWSLTHGNL